MIAVVEMTCRCSWNKQRRLSKACQVLLEVRINNIKK